jgi:hypothetical protein
MGKKIRAAKASLVAAFLAAGGAAATATKAKAVNPGPTQVSWGDPLIRFWKLDAFPSYFKVDNFAQLANFYKAQLISDASAMYVKYSDQTNALLNIYEKQHGQLEGILIGLEQYWKLNNIEPLLSALKQPGAMDAYVKFWDVMNDMQAISGREGAFGFFIKQTGILADPLRQSNGDDLV